MAHVDHTEQQLRQAWLERRRTDWPPTFEEAMASPVHEALIRLQVNHGVPVPAVHRSEVQRPEPAAPAVHARAPSSLRVPSQQPLFDRKRAAAGDRDDD